MNEAANVGKLRRSIAIGMMALFSAALGAPAPASADPAGSVTGLPLPRYVSLKTDRVNLREGPSKIHATKWVYQRAGLPVEVTAEFETWLKIRDSEGTEGWVLHSLVSGRRTALVGAGKKGETYSVFTRPADSADLAATLQAGVIASVRNCDSHWCQVEGDGYKGYVTQTSLWGVYPDEKFE